MGLSLRKPVTSESGILYSGMGRGCNQGVWGSEWLWGVVIGSGRVLRLISETVSGWWDVDPLRGVLG